MVYVGNTKYYLGNQDNPTELLNGMQIAWFYAKGRLKNADSRRLLAEEARNSKESLDWTILQHDKKIFPRWALEVMLWCESNLPELFERLEETEGQKISLPSPDACKELT